MTFNHETGRQFFAELPYYYETIKAAQVNAFGMVTCAAIWMLPMVLWQDGWPDFDYTASTWRALFGLSWLATATTYLLYFNILRRAGAANLMLVTLLTPPFAIGFGWMFLGEMQTASSALGYLIIVIGLAITDGRLLQRR